MHPWVIKTHWPKYVEGCARAGREARGEDWRVAKSIFVADDDATVRRMTRDPGNPFAYYFRNLLRKGQASRGTTFFKHDPSVADAAVTDDYLPSQLLIAARRTRWPTACSPSAITSGRSAACSTSATTGRTRARCAARWS